MSAEEVYAAMRQSEIFTLFGGFGLGDPAAVGLGNFTSIIENLPLRRDHAVLDFGCGIGRTSVPLAEYLNEGGQLVGSDVVPDWVAFCREQIGSHFANSTFVCVQGTHPHYDFHVRLTTGTMSAIDEDQFFMSYRDSFDTVVAFSVFTHFDPTMALRYLKLLRNVTKPSGHLLLTWFLDHPSNPTESRLPPGENFRDRDGQLRFAIFSPATVAEFATSAGLLIERVSYGTWRGGEWALTPLKGQHGQDIVILRRALPIEFDAKRYLEIHKDVADSGMDAVLHYLMYGCKERRTLSN